MKGYRIRDYNPDDYEDVSKLWQVTGMGKPERGDDKDTVERCIKTGGRLLILEDQQNKIIAGTSWMTFDGRRLYLHHFGILPEYQGKGLSRHLLEASLEYVKETAYQVKLEVHSSNKVAINLYKKYGFKYLGDYKIFIIRNTEGIKSN
ncbi:MAG: GNAT family N-acetyltransferase [Bacteroidota bacterium]|nr:GNAT family N-acetyltransferase [Bacteroidota bacterium]